MEGGRSLFRKDLSIYKEILKSKWGNMQISIGKYKRL
jgi:hypothetical protein